MCAPYHKLLHSSLPHSLTHQLFLEVLCNTPKNSWCTRLLATLHLSLITMACLLHLQPATPWICRWLEALASPEEQDRTDNSFSPREVQPFSSGRCWLGFVAGVVALGVTMFSSLGWQLFVASFLGYVAIGTIAALFPALFDWI